MQRNQNESVKMERKSRNKKRPPNLSLKQAALRYTDTLDTQTSRDSENAVIVQSSAPIFASVHRPRQASISAIKRENCQLIQHQFQQRQYHSNKDQLQHNNIAVLRQNQQLDVVYIGGRGVSESQNSNASMFPPSNPKSNKQLWQGMHHHYAQVQQQQYQHHQSQPNASQSNQHQVHNQAKPVSILEPFHSNQTIALSTGMGESTNQTEQVTGCLVPHPPKANAATVAPVAPVATTNHHPLMNHLQQQQYHHPQQLHQQHQQHHQYDQQQRQHQQHQQKHQNHQQRSIGQSRIPSMGQQNFNQISKTATNLLNDIYEKHLLSQTTFENVTILHNRAAAFNAPTVVSSVNGVPGTSIVLGAGPGGSSSIPNPSMLPCTSAIAHNGFNVAAKSAVACSSTTVGVRYVTGGGAGAGTGAASVSGSGGDVSGNNNINSGKGESTTSHENDFNLNNFHQKQQFIRNQHYHGYQQQFQLPLQSHQQQQQQHQSHLQNGDQQQSVQSYQRQPPNISSHHQQPPQQLQEKDGHPEQYSQAQQQHQHLYETIDEQPHHHHHQHHHRVHVVPNKIPSRKRLTGKIQRTNKSGSVVDNTSNKNAENEFSSPSLLVPANAENPNGRICTIQNSIPQPHQTQLNSESIQFNHQQRTRADGEHHPNENLLEKTKCPDSCEHVQKCIESPLQIVETSTAGMEKRTTSSGDGNQKIREVPIGSASQDDYGDIPPELPHYRFDDEINFQNPIMAKYQYRNSKIDLRLETAQAMAAAAYYARAAQKLAQNTGSATSRSRSTDMPSSTRNGGFCGALQRAPPPLPVGLARRLANKENYGIGRVKVMLRVSDNHADEETPHFMAIDKKKRQVTLTDPSTNATVATTSQERGPMVAAPKMFAFDGLFTTDDQQIDVCSSALSDVIPAVLEGSDGCLLTIGYPSSGQSRTMLGSLSPPHELGAIPCAISWLYKGINERRQKSGARFSVRVSALGVSATKPDSTSKDLLAAHATDSDDSPGVYLRDDFLGGPTELRAPTAERAALFLDAALAGRPHSSLEPAMIFTLHVYQYSLSGKGGVAGGRSRLHLIDLGGCANRNGGLPLSGIGNILLAILSGQRHLPNKDHPLTPLLKDCLAPLTCHVTILAHVSHTQTHTDALTTIQLASRIHRMRRRKHRFPIASDKAMGINNQGHQSGGSSEGPDPSSSDLSADTVIYMGPCDDATDGEHPPVYLPSLSSGDNRCAMSKILKGSGAEKPTKLPTKRTTQKPQSPIVVQRTDSLKRTNVSCSSPTASSNDIQALQNFSPAHSSSKNISNTSSPKFVGGSLRHGSINKSSNAPSPKSSPLRRPNIPTNSSNPESPMRQISEEQWIDGPRVSRSKVAEARHLLREINHVKQCETWIDGPKSTNAKTLIASNLPNNNPTPGYGYMDSHKKTMIRQWVENQSSHVFQSHNSSPTHQSAQQLQQQLHQQQLQQQLQQQQHQLQQLQQHQQQQQQPQQNQQHQSPQIQQQQQRANNSYQLSAQLAKKPEDDQNSLESSAEMVNPIENGLTAISNSNQGTLAECSVRSGLKINRDEIDVHSEKSGVSGANSHNVQDPQEEEDQDSGPSEVPPALPLIEPLSSREISHESLHRIISRHVSRESLSTNQLNVQTIDCGLQVTEEEIARTMGCEHPLAALSQGDISIVSSFNIGDAFSDCAMGERTRNQFDQLARLREIFTSQLAMAEVTPAFRMGDASSVYSEPAFRFNTGPGSVCSEPAYRPPSPRCRGCRQSMNASRTPSQTSLPSLNGIMTIAGMEQYASLRHPDGASDPNIPKAEKSAAEEEEDELANEKSELLTKRPSIEMDEPTVLAELPIISQTQISQLPLLPLSTSEAYDSGHDSSTPRTSKHSGISRRAESGYHSVATARDSDESSFTSGVSKDHNRITLKKKRQDKSLCNWLRNPFTCTYPETEGEISDF